MKTTLVFVDQMSYIHPGLQSLCSKFLQLMLCVCGKGRLSKRQPSYRSANIWSCTDISQSLAHSIFCKESVPKTLNFKLEEHFTKSLMLNHCDSFLNL